MTRTYCPIPPSVYVFVFVRLQSNAVSEQSCSIISYSTAVFVQHCVLRIDNTKHVISRRVHNKRMLEQSGKRVMLTQCSWLLHQSHRQQHQYTACRGAKHAIASTRIGTYALFDTTIRLRERVCVRESARESGIRAIMFHNFVQHRSVRPAL